MRWAWWLGLIAVVLLSAIATAPAHLLRAPLSAAQPELYASGFRGTLWRGWAQEVWWRQFGPGTVRWRTRWLPLAAGRLVIDGDLQSPWGGGVAVLRRGITGGLHWQIGALAVDFDAVPWQQVGAPLRLGGRLIAGDRFLLAGDGAGLRSAQGAAIWRDARITLPLGVDLGELSVTLADDNPEVFSWQIANRGGELAVTGRLDIEGGWRYRFSGTLSPRTLASEELLQMLDWLLRRSSGTQGEPSYRIDFSGRLNLAAGP